MELVYRVAKTRHANSVTEMLSGVGAMRYGGRWNSVGTRMVYAGSTLALATLEIAAHLSGAGIIPAYSKLEIAIPDEMILYLDVSDLPDNWDVLDVDSYASQAIGDEWIVARESVALGVPSVIIPSEYNILLNPEHPDFGKIVTGAIEPHPFDPRIKS